MPKVIERAALSLVLTVRGTEMYLVYPVYNQAIVVPENGDAIRALADTEPSAARSIRLT